VAAYNTKGPRDIIEANVSGVLGDSPLDLADSIINALEDADALKTMRTAAVARAATYDKVGIMDRMLADLGM
jgi:hypothetical protein